MTRLFRNIFLIVTLLIGGMLNASCPPNYTTSTVTLNNVTFSVCYPSVVSLSVNSGDFNIYVTITNNSGVSQQLSLLSYLPDLAGISTVVSDGCPPSINTASSCNAFYTGGGGSGKGQLVYSLTPLGNGVTTTLKATMQASAPGIYQYTPSAIIQTPSTSSPLPLITITVENTCPTITASNGVGATACVGSSATGSLYNFVTGGNSPYTFSTAGNVNGTVSVDNAGIYTFALTPTVTGGSGSFNYQAFDIAGCPSNTGTITVPISGPLAGADALYTTTFGTPVVGTLNFSGGTAPYTITTNNITNGTVQYDVPSVGQFTFTQTAPGASFFDYTVTDANGCVINDTPNNYIYSCNPGFTAGATLVNNVIYAICAPSTVTVGTTFQITATIVNPNASGTTATYEFQDMVPDPTQVVPPCPCDPGLLYLSDDGVPAGTTFTTSPSFSNKGGQGHFIVDSGNIAAGTQYSVTMNILATASGPQTYQARSIFNPSLPITVNIDVLPCPTFTAANTGIQSCNNEVVGDLSSLVEGVSGVTGPYTFSQTGVATCGLVTVSPTGAFIYTAPIGFTGPCSFSYYATSAEGCPSTDGTVTITSNLGPIATGANVFICENTILQGSLSASDGTPPYTFSIVTNGTLGTATIDDATLGTFTYVPNPNTFGNDFFTFQVTDSAGCVSNIAQYNIGILEAPSATGVSFTACENTPVNGDLAAFVTGGVPPYSFTGNGSPVGGFVNIALTGPYSFTPLIGFSGPGGFGYLVTDNAGCSSTGAVDIIVSSPTIAPSGIDLCTNFPATGNLSGQVSGGTVPYAFGATGSSVGGTVSIAPDGGYVFTPTPGFQGQASFTYQVTDAIGCLATGSLQIDYASPTASAGQASTCENITLVGGTLSATGGTPPYTFAIVTNGTLGTATITNPTTGTFNYVPNPDTFGIDSFTFQATDANGCVSNSAAFQITINQSPITSSANLSGCVNSPVVGNLTDFVSGGAIPYNFTGNGVVSGGSVTIGFTGPFAFAPFIGFTGPAGFEYVVTDNAGCSATGAVDIAVLSPIAGTTSVISCFQTPLVGDLTSLVSSGFPPYTFGLTGAPVGGSATVSLTGIYNFTPGIGFSGLGGFDYQVTDSNSCVGVGAVDITVGSFAGSDADLLTCNNTYAGTLTDFVTGATGALIFTGPSSISCGSVTIAANGDFVYTSPSGFTGPCDFVYQAFDAQGCVASGTISVTANIATTVNDGAIAVCQGASVSNTLATLVNGAPQPPLTFVIVTAPANGTLTSFNASTGAYTYTPNVGFSGVDSFQFQVTDSGVPPCTTNIGTVTITVNAAPVANGGSNITCSNETIYGSVVDFVSGGLPPYTFAQVGVAVNGTVTLNANGTYTFVPMPNFIGLGNFQYQVTDANGCVSNVGTFVIDIILCCPLSNNPEMLLILQQFWGFSGPRG